MGEKSLWTRVVESKYERRWGESRGGCLLVRVGIDRGGGKMW